MSFKVFDLSCDSDHLFEGWFVSQQVFDDQLQQGKIDCPLCGSIRIHRRPSAPRLNLGAPPPLAPEHVRPSAAQIQAMFVLAARHIVAHTEDVGERFAQEARRIHYKEAPERGIRGVASREEADALIQEGVGVFALPFGNLAKETLQ